jgi:hypothetical protein
MATQGETDTRKKSLEAAGMLGRPDATAAALADALAVLGQLVPLR